MKTKEELEELLSEAEAKQKARMYIEAEKLCAETLSATSDSEEFYEIRFRASLLSGACSLSRGNAKDALLFAQDALALSLPTARKDFEARALEVLGFALYRLSDYTRALDCMGKAVALNEELGRKNGVANNLGNIGVVYMAMRDYPRALEYYGRSLAIDEELGVTKFIASTRNNIGIVYREIGDYSRALEYYHGALAINEELGDKNAIALNLGNIGNVYESLADYPRALEYLEKALALNQELDRKPGVALNLGNIGCVYFQKNFTEHSLEKAKNFLLQAIAMLEELGSQSNRYEFLRVLSEVYLAQNRLQESLESYKLYHALEKEVLNEEAKKQAARLAVEREVAVMQREQEILLVKNQELAALNAELEDKNSQLLQLNVEKNEFLGMAAHDLKNPLSAITMISLILRDEFDSLSAEEAREFSENIYVSSKQMFELIVNLLDVNRIEQGATLTGIEVFSIADFTRDVAEKFVDSAQQKGIEIFIETSPAFIKTSPTTCVQVLDNLISNAVKYSPSDKRVFVKVEKLG